MPNECTQRKVINKFQTITNVLKGIIFLKKEKSLILAGPIIPNGKAHPLQSYNVFVLY